MDMKEDFGSSDESLSSSEDDASNRQLQQTGEDALLDSSDSSEVEDEEMEVDEEELHKLLQQINDQLASNPFAYEPYIEKIDILKKLSDLDKLRETREKFREMYPLSGKLWTDWLKDEIKLACTEDEKEYVRSLFEKAVQDYLSIDVWLEYINFAISQMDSEDGHQKCRDVFERALGSCGLHVSMGSLIWDTYRDYEAALLGATTTEEDQKLQENRFISLCRRQLSVPLLNMKETYENLKGKIEIDENTETAYKKALSKLEELETWEAKLVQKTNSEDKIATYKSYIEDEIKNKSNPARIQCLYERAIADDPLQSSLWHEYLDYLCKHLKISKIVIDSANRAVRNCSWDTSLWLKYMKIVETFSDTEELLDAMKSVFERAILYCSTGEQAGTVWLKYLEFLRRRIDLKGKPLDKELNILKKTFVAAEEHLLQLVVEPNDYMLEILVFRARFEAECGKAITDDVTNLWKEILNRGYGQYARTWLQYVMEEIKYGSDSRKIRSLYSKALSHIKDDLQIISNLWINFERDNGSLSNLEQCEAKISDQMAKQITTHVQVNYNEESQSRNHVDKNAGRKRKLNDAESGNELINVKKGRKGEDVTDSDKSNNDKSVFKVPSLPNNAKPAKKEIAPHGETVKHDSSKDNRTVFLSNLSYDTGEDEIKKFFNETGTVEEIRLAKDFKGRSKGFGYVLFSKPEEAKVALEKDRQPLGGRPAFVSKCDPDKSTRQKQFKYSTNLEKNKLFIKGLPFSLTVDELRDIFKVHGDLKDSRLVTFRNGHSKGLAYVEYHDEVCAKQALLKTDGMVIGDKTISVAISNPPSRDSLKSGYGSSSFSKPFSSSSDQIQRRTPRAFVPRSLQINAKKEGDASKTTTNNATPKSNKEFRDMFFTKD